MLFGDFLLYSFIFFQSLHHLIHNTSCLLGLKKKHIWWFYVYIRTKIRTIHGHGHYVLVMLCALPYKLKAVARHGTILFIHHCLILIRFGDVYIWIFPLSSIRACCLKNYVTEKQWHVCRRLWNPACCRQKNVKIVCRVKIKALIEIFF